MPKKRKKKQGIPFRKSDGAVIWTLTNGEEVEVSWEELKEIVKSEEWVAMPRGEFEQYYKRMKMPKGAREYHRRAKRKSELEEERKMDA